MKTFDELTQVQKKAAIAFAEKELTQLVQDNAFDIGNEIELSTKHLRYMAMAAAEGSYYSDAGQPIMNEVVS